MGSDGKVGSGVYSGFVGSVGSSEYGMFEYNAVGSICVNEINLLQTTFPLAYIFPST